MNNRFWIIFLLGSLFLTRVMARQEDESQPKEIQKLVSADGLVLPEIRKLCHMLTDDDILKLKSGENVAKRAKGTKRHVKHLCEDIEMSAWKKEVLTPAILRKVHELKWLELSYLQKSRFDDKALTLFKKVDMAWDTLTYSWRLSDKKEVSFKAKDLTNSFFWKDPGESDLHKRFNQLAKEKKIKTKDHLVLIFDEVSPSGSAPKIKVKDADLDNEWVVKWGDEIHSDVVGSHLFAALGFDIDHPFYRSQNDVTLVFPKSVGMNLQQMIAKIWEVFKVNIKPYISQSGIIQNSDVEKFEDLKPYLGEAFVRFNECALEGRPDRVKRLGTIVSKKLKQSSLRELRGAILAHMWIGNWDTREENTLVTINHEGDYVYHNSGVFSDLGTSLGVKVKMVPPDFRAGLVNEFPWDIFKESKNDKIVFNNPVNSILSS
jgi:hypothetical protein